MRSDDIESGVDPLVFGPVSVKSRWPKVTVGFIPGFTARDPKGNPSATSPTRSASADPTSRASRPSETARPARSGSATGGTGSRSFASLRAPRRSRSTSGPRRERAGSASGEWDYARPAAAIASSAAASFAGEPRSNQRPSSGTRYGTSAKAPSRFSVEGRRTSRASSETPGGIRSTIAGEASWRPVKSHGPVASGKGRSFPSDDEAPRPRRPRAPSHPAPRAGGRRGPRRLRARRTRRAAARREAS